MRNEEAHIARLLESIFEQDYPADRLEVLVFDGCSTDRSRETVEEVFADRPRCRLRLNPGITQAAAWNLGIDSATGDIMGIVSAHAELMPGYVSAAVDTLERTGADMVGGPARAVGHGAIGRAIALATSTPFGVGDARYHYTQIEEDVDAVFMGLCRRAVYERLRFDEEMVVDEDDELGYRLLDAGGRIVCNPAIGSLYRNRSSFRSLWTQYFRYGYWKVRVMQKHPAQIRFRQVVPPTFVATVIATAAIAPFGRIGRRLLAAALASYGLANLIATWKAGRSDRRALALLPFAFTILHTAYGVGFLTGVLRFRRRLVSPDTGKR